MAKKRLPEEIGEGSSSSTRAATLFKKLFLMFRSSFFGVSNSFVRSTEGFGGFGGTEGGKGGLE